MTSDPDPAAGPRPPPVRRPHIPRHDDRLGDFTTDARLLIITPMAAIVGVISALVAVALWCGSSASLTNLVYYHRFSSALVSPAGQPPRRWRQCWSRCSAASSSASWRATAREKIRGHGIPEAMEAILIGRSRMSAKVAVLKPLSSAISIGTRRAVRRRGADHHDRRRARARSSRRRFTCPPRSGRRCSWRARRAAWRRSSRRRSRPSCSRSSCCSSSGSPGASSPWPRRPRSPAAVRVPLLGAGSDLRRHAALGAGLAGAAARARPSGIAAGFASGGLTWLVYTFEDLFAKLPIHYMWWPVDRRTVRGAGRPGLPPLARRRDTTPSATSSTAISSAASCSGSRSPRR